MKLLLNNRLYIRTVLFLLVCLFLFHDVNAQEKRISLEAINEPIKNIFFQIQNLSGYKIVYSDEIVLDSMKASVSAQDQTVSGVLSSILAPQKLYCTWLTKDLLIISNSELKNNDSLLNILQITGKIINEEAQPIMYASIMVYDSAKLIAGSVTDENGKYQIRASFSNGGSKKLIVSSVGYVSDSIVFNYPDSIQNIILKKDKNTLSNITVTAKKQLVERLADRYVMNIENSVLANGYDAVELLQKTPGLWVTQSGDISINGAQSVVVMINDVVKRMSGTELVEYLRSIRSENIKKIEIIPNPPSEYEASGTGGIVHIVLKKAREDGLTGILSTRYKQQGKYGYFAPGIYTDYKLGKLYTQASLSFSADKSYYYATNNIVYPDSSLYNSFTDRYNKNSNGRALLGAFYDVTNSQTVGLQATYSLNDTKQTFITATDYYKNDDTISGVATSIRNRRPNFYGATLNYINKTDTIGSEFKFLADYIKTSKSENNDLTSIYDDHVKDSRYRNNTPASTEILSAQADFLKVYRKNFRLRAGAKYVTTTRDNAMLTERLKNDYWYKDVNMSNEFIYSENLLMAYTSIDKTIKRTSVKLGVRAEKTFMNGNSISLQEKFSRKYLDFFPSLFINQKIGKGDNMNLSYARRINRPQFSDLNPYRIQFDDYLVIVGNPDLIPEYSHNFGMGYTFNKGYSLNANYSFVKNTIAELANPIENNIIEYKKRNFTNRQWAALSIYLPFKIKEWWATSNNLILYHSNYSLNENKVSKTTCFLRTQQNFTLKNKWDINLFASYQSPYVTGNTFNASYSESELSVGKTLFDNKLRLRFIVEDIFNVSREKTVTSYKNTTINFYQKRPTRTFGISASYNFSSGKKFKVKKIEQSNDDEKSRI